MSFTGKDAIDFIHSVSWQGSKLGLERMQELLRRMGNPHHQLRYVHIAGTNGKGSTSVMLADILQQAGYRTGLYTSPFIETFHERIQINGVPISDEDLAAFTQEVKIYAEEMLQQGLGHPTEFELVTAVAFAYYLAKECEIVVLEVGLGGRLDATNVIPAPEAAVITALGMDHTAQLGNTLAEIAAEKAGILKPGCDVVLYPQSLGVEEVFRFACEKKGCRLHKTQLEKLVAGSFDYEGQNFCYGSSGELRLSLLGRHQLLNAANVVETVELLKAKGWNIPHSALQQGLRLTCWPARFELLQKEPFVVLDGAHNEQGVQTVAENLSLYFPGRRILFVTGVLADKAYAAMFQRVLPLSKRFFTATPPSPRALASWELAEFLKAQGCAATPFATVEEAIAAALQEAGAQDVVCAFGSLYMAGDVRRFFREKNEANQ